MHHPTKTKHVPGEVGVWVFILGDLVVFSSFFMTYLLYRAQALDIYIPSQDTLNRGLGLTNTLVLLASSLFVAIGVECIRSNRRQLGSTLFASAFGCGAVFCLVKVVEYGGKFKEGITLSTNDFYMFYFMLTGIHLLHLIIGMATLAVMAAIARRTQTGPAFFEGAAAYWHLVDLLWIMLFPLLYLIR